MNDKTRVEEAQARLILSAVERAIGTLQEARATLEQIEAHLAELGQEDMYPALPLRWAWDGRPGTKNKYAELYFGRDCETGGYKGPNGKRKSYVGCDPARIAQAMVLVENRRQWEEVDAHRAELQTWIDCRLDALNDLVGTALELAHDGGGSIEDFRLSCRTIEQPQRTRQRDSVERRAG